MKTVKVDLPRDLQTAEIHTFADLHIGDAFCDIERIKEHIEYVKNTPNAYAILNGDICNNATKSSVSDCYAEKLSPMQQLESFVNLFSPIKDKILCITQGNHENRTYRTEGVDLTAVAAKELGLIEKYSRTACLLFVKIGEHEGKKSKVKYPYTYSFYVTHGCGGGRKEGGKVNHLADLSSIVDADIYIHGHTHLPLVMKNSFFRADMSNCCVHQIEKLFVNSSAQLDYGGYGEAFSFKPSSKECPVIYISGVTKSFSAKL